MAQRGLKDKAPMTLSLSEEHLLLHLRMLTGGFYLVILQKEEKGANGLGNFRVFESGALGNPPPECSEE